MDVQPGRRREQQRAHPGDGQAGDDAAHVTHGRNPLPGR